MRHCGRQCCVFGLMLFLGMIPVEDWRYLILSIASELGGFTGNGMGRWFRLVTIVYYIASPGCKGKRYGWRILASSRPDTGEFRE